MINIKNGKRCNVAGSQWAKQYKRDDPTSYREALALASRPVVEVDVFRTVEDGEELFVVAADTSFWLDSLPTCAAAQELCRKMEWKVIDHKEPHASNQHTQSAVAV